MDRHAQEKIREEKNLYVAVDRASLEYDVNSIVKAFYPDRQVKVVTQESVSLQKEYEEAKRIRGEKTQGSGADFDEILITLQSGGARMEMRVEGRMPEICGAVYEWQFAPERESAECGKNGGAGETAAEKERKYEGDVEKEMRNEDSAGEETEDEDGGSEKENTSEGDAGKKMRNEDGAGEESEDKDGSTGMKIADGRNTGLEAAYKAGFKTFLYKTLEAHTGRSLPWGNLTGIRPTKIAYGLLEEGKNTQEIKEYLQKKYFVSEEKALLSIDIAGRERKLLREIHYQGGYSLYIGIPFCPTTCLYCSFTSFPIAAYRKKVESYIDCLIREMEYVSGAYADRILDTVYIGGGTPTTLEPEQLERLLGSVRKYFDFSQVKEFTVEAGRADSITREKLQVLKRHGVTRISVNPQTMKQETLDLIGRKAGVEQVLTAYELAREEGFDNINMDLILGLPGESAQDVQNTIDRVVSLAPDSLTVHSLAVKRASKLSQWILENGIEALKNTDETMKIAAEGARRLGMEPYYLYRQKNMSGNFENVGYALPGKYGLYNILIMEEKQSIVALGAGSISKRVFPDGRIERCENVKEIGLYIEKIDEMIERKKRLFGE